MSCYHPLKAFRTPTGVVFAERSRFDIIGDIELPCGRCIGCRMRRAEDWALRCMHEASSWDSNCFVTLTYGRDSVPADWSLDHRDFQLFMKRLRKAVSPSRVKFYMCGEYGPKALRPHYHACLFGVDFSDRVPLGKSASGAVFYDSSVLSSLWGHGRVSVQDLTRETAGYCARYIMKKALGRDALRAYESVDSDGVVTQRRPEYAAMSKGVGARWFERFQRDVFPHDLVATIDGGSHRVPRFYDKLYRRLKGPDLDSIEFSRASAARACSADNTDERRAVREIVHTARIRDLQRGL